MLIGTIIQMIVCGNVWGQDPNYSQFYNNPIYYNSSMTGINDGTTLRSNVRNQWGPIPGRFNTVSVSVDAQSLFKMGFGLNMYSDIAGEAFLRTNGASMTYSYRMIDAKNLVLQTGVSAGVVTKALDWDKLVFSDQLDETRGVVYSSQFIPSSSNRITYADLNSGAVIRFNGANKRRGAFKRITSTFGGSVHHLSQPKDDFLGSEKSVPLRFIYHGDVQMLINDVIIRPGLIFEHQRTFKTFSMGINFVQKPFTFGLWVRNRTFALSGNAYDSFIFTTGMNLKNWNGMTPKIQYSYDITVSRLKTSSFGTHEITLVLEMPNKVLLKNSAKNSAFKRTYSCPSGFDGYN
ncbi:MAG: PorP/SprF family type IX secretion system membrane protein [Bacteroidetes bacterium]|nr:PorP/SprF family type IX secretion system membrane protein [Bacteroidota bacterium]